MFLTFSLPATCQLLDGWSRWKTAVLDQWEPKTPNPPRWLVLVASASWWSSHICAGWPCWLNIHCWCWKDTIDCWRSLFPRLSVVISYFLLVKSVKSHIFLVNPINTHLFLVTVATPKRWTCHFPMTTLLTFSNWSASRIVSPSQKLLISLYHHCIPSGKQT